MEKSDFELYYHKGGTYILPIETFNELFDEMESWKKDCKQKGNIIKEVREEVRIYEEQSNDGTTNELDNYVFVQRLKKVLDKEDKK